MIDHTILLSRLSADLLPLVAFAWLLCFISVVIYRLWICPIAKIPGPKLAALTRWYEFYYDIILKGQFVFHIQELHKKYGPVIRISPEEVHVLDSDFWDELFARNQRTDKYHRLADRFGISNSIFSTADYSLSRLRRRALDPMFSRRQIVNYQHVIGEKVDLLCKNIAGFEASGREFCIQMAWSAFAGDVVMEYSFGFCYNHVRSTNFEANFHEAFRAMAKNGALAAQFPWLHTVLNSMSDGIIGIIDPALQVMLRMRKDLTNFIAGIVSGTVEKQESSHPILFDEVLKSNLPAAEKTVNRLSEEAQLVVGAGLETTSWALTVASFHILNSPEINGKLTMELERAIPDPAKMPTWQELERLPYLRGCILEGLRLSYGVSSRHHRLLDKTVIHKNVSIPSRTPICMTIVDVHHDENIFPSSFSFMPERWMNNPRAPNGFPLDRYLVSFGKGQRSCLGINLAYAMLYLSLAAVFRRFKLELYETDLSDIELQHDYFIPIPKLDSKGVRIRVKSANWN